MHKPVGAACGPAGSAGGVCRVESLVSIDERGQMVLPKEIREKAGLRAGEKMALISWAKDDRICCISLVKAGDLAGMVKGLLGPMLQELADQDEATGV